MSEIRLNAQLDSASARPPTVSVNCALFLDVDGCLLEFADDPSSVRATPRLIAMLDALEQRLDGALALVSGRTLAAIDEIFSPARYTAVGLHGLEHRGGVDAPAHEPRLATVVEAARVVVDAYPGALIEDKGRSLALHWRAAPAAGSAIQAFMAQALKQLPGYRLEPGNQVIELRPQGADKGSAIRDLMATPRFTGRMPVFAGDDLTDEAGFATVNDMGGISVLVGERLLSAATHHLADPAAVLEWLEQVP